MSYSDSNNACHSSHSCFAVWSILRSSFSMQPKRNVLFQHVTMLATSQRKFILKLKNYLTTEWWTDKPKASNFPGL